ncbi:MAG: hypothetical protein Q3962_06015 [Corynebacterium sp.]|nr:hypothetical protein [Corynebacterium sp.]
MLKTDRAWRAYWTAFIGKPAEEYTIEVTDRDDYKSPKDGWKIFREAEAGQREKKSANDIPSQISKLQDYLSIWAKEGSESVESELASSLKSPDGQQTFTDDWKFIDYTVSFRYPLAENDPLPNNAEDFIKLLDSFEEVTAQYKEVVKRSVAYFSEQLRGASAQQLDGRSADEIVASYKNWLDAELEEFEAKINLEKEFAKLYFANRDEVARKCASLGEYENSWSMPQAVKENNPDQSQQEQTQQSESPVVVQAKKGILEAAAAFVGRMTSRIFAVIIHVLTWIF